MYSTKCFVFLATIGIALGQNTSSPDSSIRVLDSGGNATSPLQYGIMFEDISHSGDGGIYAELIRNRAFQGSDIFPADLTAWGASKGASLSLDSSSPLSAALPNSVKVTAGDSGVVSLVNEGWWGIEVKPQTYSGSFYVKGQYSGQFVASLQSMTSGDTYAVTNVTSNSVADSWTQHNFTLNPTSAASDTNNTFSIAYDAAGASGPLNFNLISLFPPTYNNRPNGMRADLMEALKGLAPSFLRFPGGNNLEGIDPPYRWKWNETIGPLATRPGRPGVWEYQQTDGLGLIEYLWWCQDLNMEPILDVWAGFYLGGPVVSEADLGPYVQDVLNELEFIMGDASTEYGGLRASLGYPDPIMQIKYVEVGNEDNLGGGQPSYNDYRFPAFYNAIKQKYPDMNILASVVDPALPRDAIEDYHTYSKPDDLVARFNLFDQNTVEDLTLVGEYANSQPNDGGPDRIRFPNWLASVSEAVFLIGLERNAHAILGAAYAPVLQNLDSYQWTPNMISFTADTSQTVLSTSYQQFKLFSNTRMTTTLPITTAQPFGPSYFVAGKNEATNSYLLKAAVYDSSNTLSGEVPFNVYFDGLTTNTSVATATLTVLTAPGPDAMNMPGSPEVVKTDVRTLTADKNGGFAFGLPNLSVALLEARA